MSDQNTYSTESFNQPERGYEPGTAPEYRRRHPKTHIWLGLLLLVVGAKVLLNKLGFELPEFLFSWQMFLIALGVIIGIRKDFQGVGWLIVVLIGTLFLIDEFAVYGELRRFIVPIVLIGAGLFFIFKPRGHFNRQFAPGPSLPDSEVLPPGAYSAEDVLDATSIFGGTKKKIFSKNFRGGEMVNIFGGSQIDLTQADLNGTAILDVTILFGGATLLVPGHWNVVSDAVAILGEVKDKRVVQNSPETKNKTLLIKGTVIFGGVDVKSF
jgi:predicted membrane protein